MSIVLPFGLSKQMNRRPWHQVRTRYCWYQCATRTSYRAWLSILCARVTMAFARLFFWAMFCPRILGIYYHNFRGPSLFGQMKEKKWVPQRKRELHDTKLLSKLGGGKLYRLDALLLYIFNRARPKYSAEGIFLILASWGPWGRLNETGTYCST